MRTTEAILYPRDFFGTVRTVTVSGTSLTIRSSVLANPVVPADYTVPVDVITAAGTYELTMAVPMLFTPAGGTNYKVD